MHQLLNRQLKPLERGVLKPRSAVQGESLGRRVSDTLGPDPGGGRDGGFRAGRNVPRTHRHCVLSSPHASRATRPARPGTPLRGSDAASARETRTRCGKGDFLIGVHAKSDGRPSTSRPSLPTPFPTLEFQIAPALRGHQTAHPRRVLRPPTIS